MFNMLRSFKSSLSPAPPTELEVIAWELAAWLRSPKRQMQITGAKYYAGEHEILARQRTVLGPDGVLSVVANLPNNRLVDNQYAKMVDQKVNYLLAKPLTWDDPDTAGLKAWQDCLGANFHVILKHLGEDALNGGVAWLYPYYLDGELAFKSFPAYEILPFWQDSEHTVLQCAVRFYQVEAYLGPKPQIIDKVEIYYPEGIAHYTWQNGSLTPDAAGLTPYLTADGAALSWGRIPLLAFRAGRSERPLIQQVKSLQDAINALISDFANNLQEDSRNTILVLKNYDGEDLAQFRHNLATYGAVKVKTVDGTDGAVETLQVAVNSANYQVVLRLLHKALIENARGFDAKDDRLLGAPNQMNIQSMYADLDLDAAGMESEFQAALERLGYFINLHLGRQLKPRCIFNRDMLINETEAIDNCLKSRGFLSEQSALAQHPWVSDAAAELRARAQEAAHGVAQIRGLSPRS